MRLSTNVAKRYVCDNCSKDTFERHSIQFKDEEQKICGDCFKFFESSLGRIAEHKSSVSKRACRFCRTEIYVSTDIECENCRGRVRKIRGMLGIRRSEAVAATPPDIAVEGSRKKDQNPLKPQDCDFDFMTLDEYYSKRYSHMDI